MKKINIPPQPKPYMPYGYYTPLLGLDEEPKKTKVALAPTPKKAEQLDLPKTPEVAQKSHLFSFKTAKTVLKYTALAVTALATGVFIYNIAQNPNGLPQNPGAPKDNGFVPPCQPGDVPTFTNQSYANQSTALALGQQVPNSFEAQARDMQATILTGLTAALAKTGSDLVTVAADPGSALGTAADVAGRVYEKGLERINSARADAIAMYYGFEEELEEVPLTEHDKRVLDIRTKHPAYYTTSFISRALADGRSAIGKVIALAAAKGEAPTPFAQYASFGRTSSVKYTLSSISSPEKIERILGKKKSKEEFVAEEEEFFGYKEGKYEEYAREYDEKARRFNKIKEQVLPKTFEDLQEAHFREAAATSDYVKTRFMYMTPEAPKETNELAAYHGKTQTINSIWRTEYARQGVEHDANKANFDVSETTKGDLLVSRGVWDTESKGKASSSWDKFTLGCSYYPEREEVHCTNRYLRQLDHAFGPVKYDIAEKMVSEGCSLVRESFESPLINREYTYAINPKRKLPIIFSQFVDSERFATKKVKSFWSAMTGGVDAVVAFSPKLPKDLPATCDELRELENPKPKLAAGAEKPNPATQPLGLE